MNASVHALRLTLVYVAFTNVIDAPRRDVEMSARWVNCKVDCPDELARLCTARRIGKAVAARGAWPNATETRNYTPSRYIEQFARAWTIRIAEMEERSRENLSSAVEYDDEDERKVIHVVVECNARTTMCSERKQMPVSQGIFTKQQWEGILHKVN